jgi:5-methylthioribose kinase
MADPVKLDETNIPDYIRSTPALAGRIDVDRLAYVRDVGDGNVNWVYIVRDLDGRGVCLKQAMEALRIDPNWLIPPERARREADALLAYGRLTPGLVPEVFDYNPERNITAMENLDDHIVWQKALIKGERHNGAAEALGRYVGALAFGTSLFALERHELSRWIAKTQNPDLALITEDLVFTEPLVDLGRNSVLPANERDAAEFAADAEMMKAMGYAKWVFMTHAEALIHGDLHAGSVMVRKPAGSDEADSVKAFDPEFGFMGPVAFDLGALYASYVIAAARAFALREDERAAWCLELVSKTWDSFEAEFRRRWPERIDPRVFGDAFLEQRLATWREEAWLFAAAKMSRRIVGMAKRADIETLPPEQREGAARGVLQLSRTLVRERAVDSAPARFEALAAGALTATRTP